MKASVRFLCVLSLTWICVACGGGGGNGPASSNPPPAVDTSPPVITLTGDDPQIIVAGNPYIEQGATAIDNVDGDLSSSITIDATEVDTQLPGAYSVTYDVVDAAGNAADTVTRAVDVLASSNPPPAVDTSPPVITLTGDDPQIIVAGNPYIEQGATAIDNVDGDLSSSITIDAIEVDTQLPGAYSVTYDVVDAVGNAADTVTRTVDVLASTSDFAHVGTPHVMSKNSFALPSQTDQFHLLEPRLGQVPLMVILLEFPDSQHDPAHTSAYFEDLIFGGDPSVNGYFDEISYGKFSFLNAGITGWLMAPSPASYYFDASQTDNQYTTLAAVAVQAAVDAGVDFDTYDQNADGKVTRDELQLLVPMADHPISRKPNLMATRFNQQVAQGVSTQAGTEIDTLAARVEEITIHDDRAGVHHFLRSRIGPLGSRIAGSV